LKLEAEFVEIMGGLVKDESDEYDVAESYIREGVSSKVVVVEEAGKSHIEVILLRVNTSS
jgi:hypothetical protein